MANEHSDLKEHFGAENAASSNPDETEITELDGSSADCGLYGLRQRARDSSSNTSRTTQANEKIEAW